MIALVVAAAFALERIGHSDPRSRGATATAGRTMPLPGCPVGLEFKLQSMVRRTFNDRSVFAQREPIEKLARKIQCAVEETADQNLGRDPELWLFYEAKLRLAALDLGQAAGSGVRPALLGAARQIDLTCVGCHSAFRH